MGSARRRREVSKRLALALGSLARNERDCEAVALLHVGIAVELLASGPALARLTEAFADE